MRKALIVGVDYYDHLDNLRGAVNDAHSVRTVLERNADGTLNFATPQLLTSTGPDSTVPRRQLRQAVHDLFADDAEIALFYFAGHGFIDETGGFLCASDCRDGDDGLALSDVLSMANRSNARNKIIILDSCHAGVAGSSALATEVAELSNGLTILTASTAEQYALETGTGSGVFTDLLVDALSGAAANLVGAITPGSVYAHIDQSLGAWAQRPMFKTNVKTFVSLREADPPIALTDLQKLTEFFTEATTQFALDPSFEPERSGAEDSLVPPPDALHTAQFAALQNLVKVNLVRPVGAPHMWHAAMSSKACELTVLGQHYWNLVHEGLI